jgi:putative two-component system response regulator
VYCRYDGDHILMDGTADMKVIVVVEDDEVIAELLTDVIYTEPDYHAVAAPNGAEAMELIRSVKPSCILLGSRAPGPDGYQLHEILKQDETTRNIPVFFLTCGVDGCRGL